MAISPVGLFRKRTQTFFPFRERNEPEEIVASEKRGAVSRFQSRKNEKAGTEKGYKRKRPGRSLMFLNDMELLMFLAVTASLLGYCQTDEKGNV